MSASAGRTAAVVVGALLSLSAALGLLAAAVLTPAHYVADLGTRPDITQVIRSVQTSWLGASALSAALYVGGLVLLGFRRGSAPSVDPRPGLLPKALGTLLLLAAAFWFFVGAALGPLVPAYFTGFVTMWAILLVGYVWTSLWGRLLRPLGLALTLAGVLAAAWVLLAPTSLEQGKSPGLVYTWMLEGGSESGGIGSTLGEIHFLSTTLSLTPLASSILLVLGLPLLILPSRRKAFTASMPALGVGVLLLISSMLLPRTLRVAGLLQSVALPEISGSALDQGLPGDSAPPRPPARAPLP